MSLSIVPVEWPSRKRSHKRNYFDEIETLLDLPCLGLHIFQWHLVRV